MNNSPRDMDMRGKLYDLEGALRDAGGSQTLRDDIHRLIRSVYDPGQERRVVAEAIGLAEEALGQGGRVSVCASRLLDAAAGVHL